MKKFKPSGDEFLDVDGVDLWCFDSWRWQPGLNERDKREANKLWKKGLAEIRAAKQSKSKQEDIVN